MLHYHILDRSHSIGGGQSQGSGQDDGGEVCGIQLLETINPHHGGQIVSLAVSLVMSQVVMMTQVSPLPDTILQHGDQGANVSKPEVDPLASERMDSVGCVADEDSSGTNVSGGVTKPKREYCSVDNSFDNRRFFFVIFCSTSIGQNSFD